MSRASCCNVLVHEFHTRTQSANDHSDCGMASWRKSSHAVSEKLGTSTSTPMSTRAPRHGHVWEKQVATRIVMANAFILWCTGQQRAARLCHYGVETAVLQRNISRRAGCGQSPSGMRDGNRLFGKPFALRLVVRFPCRRIDCRSRVPSSIHYQGASGGYFTLSSMPQTGGQIYSKSQELLFVF